MLKIMLTALKGYLNCTINMPFDYEVNCFINIVFAFVYNFNIFSFKIFQNNMVFQSRQVIEQKGKHKS